MAVTFVQGGLILGYALGVAKILPRQVMLYRDCIRLIFAPA